MANNNNFLFQRDWNVYQGRAWKGMPGNQDGHLVIRGVVSTGSHNDDRKPEPGYPVYYNRTDNRWQVPRTTTQIQSATGVLLYRPSDILNDDHEIVYDDDTVVEIMIRGTVWVESGTALAPFQAMTWDNGDEDWIARDELATDPITDIVAHTALTGNNAADINTALTELEGNINQVKDDTESTIVSTINKLGFTRFTSIAPSATSAGDLVEVYLPGGAIV